MENDHTYKVPYLNMTSMKFIFKEPMTLANYKLRYACDEEMRHNDPIEWTLKYIDEKT